MAFLTAVAAVGVLTVGSTDENGQSPYLEVPGGELMAKENGQNGADQENTGDNAQAAAEASQEDLRLFAQKNTDENAGNNPLTDNENTAENKNTGNDLCRSRGRKTGSKSPGVKFYRYQFPYLAGKRKCDPGLQYGSDYLFSYSGSV